MIDKGPECANTSLTVAPSGLLVADVFSGQWPPSGDPKDRNSLSVSVESTEAAGFSESQIPVPQFMAIALEDFN